MPHRHRFLPSAGDLWKCQCGASFRSPLRRVDSRRELPTQAERRALLSRLAGLELLLQQRRRELGEGPRSNPPIWQRGSPFHRAVNQCARDLVIDALQRTRGNRTLAAGLLGLQRTHLQRLLREWGIQSLYPPQVQHRTRGSGRKLYERRRPYEAS